ncbi:MAG: RNA polymerase sigma-70 factor [Bacteroidales bacterium]|nr:RNA polymerase sigma-70 factor [Bacteroidales bacterium]
MLLKNSYNEEILIRGLKEGNHESFKKLFEVYSKPLHQFSYSYLKSTEAADDVVQEVFVKIWENRKQLLTGTSFKSYLFTIALNTIRKQFNSLSKAITLKHEILLEFSTHKTDFDDSLDFQRLLTKLDELIAQMPEKRKLVFVRSKLEKKSHLHIAEELSISVKTVEYHISEAMKYLKAEFEKLRISGLIFFCLFLEEK